MARRMLSFVQGAHTKVTQEDGHGYEERFYCRGQRTKYEAEELDL